MIRHTPPIVSDGHIPFYGCEKSPEGEMSKQRQNEAKFGNWKQIPEGGRLYWIDVPGRSGWRARYWKEVDAAEITRKFWQEIYDSAGKLVGIHEKYPVDNGHQKV